MISNLILACGLACGVATGSISQNRSITRDNEFVEANDSENTLYEKVAKYQSNEVNIIDDLIVGNIYQLNSLYYNTTAQRYETWSGYFDNNISVTLLSAYVVYNSIDFDEISGYNFYPIIEAYADLDFINFTICLYFNTLNTWDSDYSLYFELNDVNNSYIIFQLDDDAKEYFCDYDINILKMFISYTDYQEYEYRAIPGTTHSSNLYRLIYNFYYGLFEDSDLSSITATGSLPFDSWIAHTLTIVTLLVLVFCGFLLLRWIFKIVSGLILLKR